LFPQLDTIDAHLNKTPPQRRSVIYFDSAQRSQPFAFERDILLLKQRSFKINPDIKIIVISNQLELKQLNYPLTTLSSLDTMLGRIEGWSKKRPV
jgi:hypothetical protein